MEKLASKQQASHVLFAPKIQNTSVCVCIVAKNPYCECTQSSKNSNETRKGSNGKWFEHCQLDLRIETEEQADCAFYFACVQDHAIQVEMNFVN